MRLSLLLTAAITLATINLVPSKIVQAAAFNEQELNQNQFAVIAAPYRHGYNLVVVEQIPGQKKCWSETGTSPTVVKPLFLNFDFSKACIRNADSNNYSIRFNGQDYGMDYLVNIVKQDDELHLIGVPRDRTKPQLHLGRTHGLSSGSLKIILDPQWQLTKRIYNGNATNHIYLSNTSKPESKLVSQAVSPSTPAYQQPNNYVPVPNFNSGVQPTNLTYQPPLQNNYQQPVYQQPVYATPPITQQPVSNLYQQPVYQQPVYVMPAIPPQPMSNVYQQPVYPVQPVYNGYRQ
ncbi:MAG: DUF3747 domain-containing protein [Waterburya sp.]